MRAVTVHGKGDLRVDHVPEPTGGESEDVRWVEEATTRALALTSG